MGPSATNRGSLEVVDAAASYEPSNACYRIAGMSPRESSRISKVIFEWAHKVTSEEELAAFGVIVFQQTLVEFRQHGIFRRNRVPPMPSFMLNAAPPVVGAAVIVVSLALTLVVGWSVFDVRFAGSPAMVSLAISVSYIAFGPRESFPDALQLAAADPHAYDLHTYLWLGATWGAETTINVPIWVSSPT